MYLKSLEQGEMLASQWEDADVEAGGAAAAAAAQEEAKEKEVTRPPARSPARPLHAHPSRLPLLSSPQRLHSLALGNTPSRDPSPDTRASRIYR